MKSTPVGKKSATRRIQFPDQWKGNGAQAPQADSEPKRQVVQVTAPDIRTAVFKIIGTAPLVVHRIDKKVEQGFHDKIVSGSTPKGKKKFDARDPVEICEAAKYIGETNGVRWEGFNASGIRLALISACRLTNVKMTLAKLSLFVVEDGRDVLSPIYPLVRIFGKAEKTEMVARTETGVAMLTIRPMYYPWSANLRIRYDNDQFKLVDVTNLLARAGAQVGICEGRPDSKNSGGMGWGTFEIANEKVS